MEDLPPTYRVAIVLRDVEGFSMREVGDALKISVANAKSRVMAKSASSRPQSAPMTK